jgi:hypothetical protein
VVLTFSLRPHLLGSLSAVMSTIMSARSAIMSAVMGAQESPGAPS